MADMRSLEQKLSRRALLLTQHAVTQVTSETAQDAPIKTGRMRRRIKAQPVVVTGFRYRTAVTSDTPYDEFTDVGTRRHRIRPRGPWPLKFYWPRVGRVVRFNAVWHPGFRGRRWFTKPMKRRWRVALQQATRRVRT